MIPKWTKAETIKAAPIFISNRIQDKWIEDFFVKVLEQFKNELQILADQWYNYENEPGIDNCGTEEVFSLIERSYVGLFNNAVIRCFKEDAVLQEFSISFEEKRYKRADYIVKHHFGNSKTINFLFEAKQRQFDTMEYSESEIKGFFKPFLDKARLYYNRQKDYYREETYLVALVFEWVRYRDQRDKVAEWKKSLEDGHTDFYCFYYSDLAGLMVHGKLEKTGMNDSLKIYERTNYKI